MSNRYDRFLFTYTGNKYLETKKMFKDFDFNQYDIIAEPMCGIFGFSRYAYESGFKGEFLLNDLSTKLIDSLNELKQDIPKTCSGLKQELSKYTNDKDLSYDKNKSYSLELTCRANSRLCQIVHGNTKITNFLEKENMYKEMFKRITFFNMESNQFIQQLPKDKKICIFYDPPYFNSCNRDYHYNNKLDDDNYNDGTSIYIDILNNFKTVNHTQIMIINHTDLIHYLFKEWYNTRIVGKYQLAKKNVKKHNVYIVSK